MTSALLTVAACGLLASTPVRLAEGTVAPHTGGGVALTTADGRVLPLAETEASRLLFRDPALHNRAVRLTVKSVADGRLTLAKVQTVTGGKPFDVDYWCENCQLGYPEPGACKCCGGDTVLRERPAK
jgi:rRNA maturation endonuclease Nob1